MLGSGSCCSVAFCKNTGRMKKSSRPDLMFHRFPKDPGLRDLWIKKCGREEAFNIESATVCSDHFATEDYKRNLRAELLGEGKSRKLLHPDVVPHRNLPPDVEKNEDFKDLEKKYQLSDEEKIAKRKALVEEAIKWAESLPSKSKFFTDGSVNLKRSLQICENAKVVAQKRPLLVETDSRKSPKIKLFPVNSEIEKVIDGNALSVQILKPTSMPTFQPQIVESISLQPIKLPILTPIPIQDVPLPDKKLPFRTIIPTESSTSTIPEQPEAHTSTPDFSVATLEDIKKITADNEEYKEKFLQLQSRYDQLNFKYKRCYNTLCCFKTAYNKLRSQNNTAKNKIIELRQRCKTFQRQIKDAHKSKSQKHKQIQTQTENEDSEGDVTGWW